MTRHDGILILLGVAAGVTLFQGCGGSSTPPPPSISVTVSPSTVSVPIGATQQFTAMVTGTSNAQVTWSIQGAGMGNSTVGSISNLGLYTAPNAQPSPNSVTIVANSQADASASGTAAVAVTVPTPTLSSLSPIVTLANVGMTLTASGSGFAGTSQIVFNGSTKATTLTNGQLTAQLSASDVAKPGTYRVSVQTNSMSSSSLSFFVVPAVNPNSVSLVANSTSKINIAVQQPKAFGSSPLSWVAVGSGNSAGVTALTVKQGGSVTLFTVGRGFQAGILFAVSGNPSDVSVTQPLLADFGQTTDGIPSANVTFKVSSSAAPGARNILVTNPAGEVSVFPGGLIITQGP